MGYLRIMYDCLPKPSLGLFGCVQKLDLTYHQFMASEVSSKKKEFLDEPETSVQKHLAMFDARNRSGNDQV